MIPVDPRSDPINQEDNPEGIRARAELLKKLLGRVSEKLSNEVSEELSKKLFEKYIDPLTGYVMVDPQVNEHEYTADAWTYYQSDLSKISNGQPPLCPFTNQPMDISKLRSNKILRDEIDLVLNPTTIKQREQYHRACRYEKLLVDFPSKLKISSIEWRATSPALMILISQHMDKVEKLFRQSHLSWSEFSSIDIEILNLLLSCSQAVTDLVALGFSHQTLCCISTSRLQNLLNHIELIKELILTHRITYKELLQTSDEVIEALTQNPNRICQFMTETEGCFSWLQLSGKQLNWLIAHIEHLNNLKKEEEKFKYDIILNYKNNMKCSRIYELEEENKKKRVVILNYKSIIQYLIQNADWVKWLSEETVVDRFTSFYDFMKIGVSYKTLLETPREGLSLLCNHPDLFKTLITGHHLEYKELIQASPDVIRIFTQDPEHTLQFFIFIQLPPQLFTKKKTG